MFSIKRNAAVVGKFLTKYKSNNGHIDIGLSGYYFSESLLYKMINNEPSALIIPDSASNEAFSVNHLYIDGDYDPEFISKVLIEDSHFCKSILITSCCKFNCDKDWKLLGKDGLTYLLSRRLIDNSLYDLHNRTPFIYKKRNLLMRLLNRFI